MASNLCRLSSRLVGSQLRRQVLSRAFHGTPGNNAATAFTMPAMSPTMTEGTISSWKVKEGDEYSTGDILMEIETDKAQMDVEAQEDGVMAKIMVPSGSKGIPVGTRIAVLAEQGDDLSTLEIPPEETPSKETTTSQSSSANKDTTSPAPSEKSSKVESSAKSTPSTAKKHPAPKTPHTPSPSVAHMLRAHGISPDDAGAIAGTGPKGRLLKGDILAHLGMIQKNYPSELENRLEKLEKLDLSNIKIVATKKPEAKKEKPVPELPKEAEISMEISFGEVLKVQDRLQSTLGFHLPLSTFISKATATANSVLPNTGPATSVELFDELVTGARRSKVSSGSFTPKISPMFPPLLQATAPEVDIIDILSGKASAAKPAIKSISPVEGLSAREPNVISLKVPVAEEARAKVFLQRVKGLLEEAPGQLVL